MAAAASVSPWAWTFDPLQLAPIVLAAVFYWRRARTLGRSGRRVSSRHQSSFALGLAFAFVAVSSPIDAVGENYLFSVHMIQHLLLGDLAPLLIILGLSRPLLRPLLALPVVGRARVLTHPLVALPLWAIDLYCWHAPPLYNAALSNDAIHALEHTMFFLCGAFMWAALFELLPGPAWFGTGAKLLYVLAVRVAGMVLANFFIWSGSTFYTRYATAPRLWGLSPSSDQNFGGVVMLGECSLVTLCAFAWVFLRWAADTELRQELLELGMPARTVERAVRYGRGAALRETAISTASSTLVSRR